MRNCPSEQELGEYIAGIYRNNKAGERIETHLCECQDCRAAVIAAHRTCRERGTRRILVRVTGYLSGKKYLLSAMLALFFSFTVRRYFFQFLGISMILWLKVILDSRAARFMLMVKKTCGDERDGHPRGNTIREDNGTGKDQ
ncbi:MAG: hypothetical protein PHQ61_06260 [Candidatus Omnitrophica bacterium]|nr:hypothetical protein [Candidatus Omnitrophota bacterium]